MKRRKHIILFTLFVMNLVDQPAPEVTIAQGTLSGKISGDGLFFEYHGIPYATVDSNTRFQAPLPAPSWKGIFKAVDETSQCPQYAPYFPFKAVGTEDCLKINVYVPAMVKKPLPVMVYIHGGAFIMGDSGKNMYAPDFLLKHEVIVVSFNYRLGVLGFLCLGIKEAPGNAGLKDQVAALKWVKKNIAAFGGDPDNVTIFGHSAGGASVALLVASEAANGLFDKAIVVSGSSLANWAINRDPVFSASQIAKRLGYHTENPMELYKIFSKVSIDDLVLVSGGKPIGHLLTSQMLQLPCVEREIPGVQHFLTDLPYNILAKTTKNIPIIYGSMNREGLMFISEETAESLELSNKRTLFGNDLTFKSKEEETIINGKVKEFYFGDEIISQKTLMNLSELYSHLYFSVPVILEAELMTNVNEANIYNYDFAYSGKRNLIKKSFGFANEEGACHGDDIFYLFNSNILKLNSRKKQDEVMIKWMTKMFTNFAKYGDPTPDSESEIPIKWTPSKKDSMNVLTIDKELQMGPIPIIKAYQFWKDIYKKYSNFYNL